MGPFANKGAWPPSPNCYRHLIFGPQYRQVQPGDIDTGIDSSNSGDSEDSEENVVDQSPGIDSTDSGDSEDSEESSCWRRC